MVISERSVNLTKLFLGRRRPPKLTVSDDDLYFMVRCT